MASTSETTEQSTITSTTVHDGGAPESKQEHLNGAVATPAVGQEEEDEMIGPGPAPAKQRQKRPLQFEQAFLDALPSAAMCALSTLAIWGQDLVASVAEGWLTEVFCFAGTRRAICIGMLSRTSPYLLLTSSSLGVQMVISLIPVSVSEYHVFISCVKILYELTSSVDFFSGKYVQIAKYSIL